MSQFRAEQTANKGLWERGGRPDGGAAFGRIEREKSGGEHAGRFLN